MPLLSRALGLVTVLAVSLASGAAHAGFKVTIEGVSVSYSGDGADAYYDAVDGTLTIVIDESGGSLKIKGGSECVSSPLWDGFVDVYLVAGDAVLSSISIKGTPDCEFFLAGTVDYVQKLSITSGFVGDLTCYPLSFGLYANSVALPKSISIKNGWAEAPVLGTPPAELPDPDPTCAP